MRKAQKETAISFVQTLYQANKHIKELLDQKDTVQAMELLGQCQQEAISFGELLEKTEGEACPTIGYIEQYCEETYQLYVKLRENEPVNNKQTHKLFRRQLIQVENSVKNDILQELEIVFLPYNASMWDSLESVWKAADEDPCCNVYVIPIPYYDRNKDGSLNKEHWEGNLFPDYVPVTRHEDYDFAERRPDVIFIHNPYDNFNYVTSVHPFFYSKNLKRFTDNLVYIPYFILDEISPDDRQEIEKMKHFCTAPGVINADKVVVQSEDLRQIYIDVVTKAAGADTRGYWTKKISGLGSPKADKVLNSKKEDLIVPDGWMKKIRKPDGSWKKIIFYNISIGPFLYYRDKMLDKIRDVLEIFEENRDDVVLLWRPHPLLEATVESMHPQLLKRYQKLVDDYRRNDWGIYDDTADMNRAVLLSDGYYGDTNASAVPLYGITRKPALIQDPNVNMKDKSFKLSFEDAVIEKEKLIFPAGDCDMICLYDFKNGITKKFKGYASEDIFKQHQYGAVCKYGPHEYLFAPSSGSKILLYHSEKNEFSYIDIENVKGESSKLFGTTLQNGKYVYLLPGTYPAIVRFDCEDNTVDYYGNWLNKLKNHVKKGEELFGHGCGLIGENLFLASKTANQLVKFNLLTQAETLITVGSSDTSYSAICSDEKNCWLATSDGTVMRWDPVSQKCEIIDLPQDIGSSGYLSFSGLLYFDKRIYAVPYSAKDAVVINQETLQARILHTNDTMESCWCSFSRITENKLYLYYSEQRRLLEIDLLQGKPSNSYTIYEDQDDPISRKDFYWKNCWDKSKNQYIEADSNSLSFFLDAVKRSSIDGHREKAGLIGKQIWDSIVNA